VWCAVLYGLIHAHTSDRKSCSRVLTLHHTATHCNTLQHTATHCITLQHTASHCITLHHTATHCNTLHHTATHCNTLQHTASHCNTLQHTTHDRRSCSRVLFCEKSASNISGRLWRLRYTCSVLQCVAVCCKMNESCHI